MMNRELLRALAAANGLTIPEERLDLVLREYDSLTRALAELDTLPLTREIEPAHIFPLAPPSPTPGSRR